VGPKIWKRASFPLLLVVSLTTAGAHAADPKGAIEEFKKGRQAYYEGRYEDAIKNYERALSLKYSAKLFYNIGLAFEKLGQPAKAKEAFTRYLKEEPTAPNAEEVKKRLAELERQIQEEKARGRSPVPQPQPGPRVESPQGAAPARPLSPEPVVTGPVLGPPVNVDIQSQPTRAEVFVDGRMVGITPLRMNLFSNGTYKLRLEKTGYAPFTRRYQVRDRDLLHFTLQVTAEGRVQYMTRTEWFALEPCLGGTPDSKSPSIGIQLQLFGLRWKYFVWTILEFGGFGGGINVANLGTRPGFPLYFGDRGQHQLRASLGMNVGYMMALSKSVTDKTLDTPEGSGFVLSPTIEYRFQSEKSFFLGVALRAFVLTAGGLKSGSHKPAAFLITIPLGWASSLF
jgi:hypothetical protein